MALVGVGDLIVSVKILVGVGDLIHYLKCCIFLDLVGAGVWKIPAVYIYIYIYAPYWPKRRGGSL